MTWHVGKTILSSVLIESVREIADISLVFFYCKYKDAQRNTFVSLARGLLAQLLQMNKALLPYLYEKASSSAESCLTLQADAEELLETALQSLGKVYVIIDGLDECDKVEKMRILTWFKNFVLKTYQDNPESVRCLFVSQDDGDLRKSFAKIPTFRLADDDNAKDIESYAISWSKKIQNKFDLDEDKCAGIVAGVSTRAKGKALNPIPHGRSLIILPGMFLFAKLVMTNLHFQTSRANLDRQLKPDKFPSGLDQA